MYEALKHTHSGLRWVVIILLIAMVVQLFQNRRNLKLSSATMGFFHLQVVIGIILYFFLSPITNNLSFNMGDATSRFYGVEHIFGMIVGVILVTIGHKHVKGERLRTATWFYLATLLVTLVSIPWPFRIESAGWF